MKDPYSDGASVGPTACCASPPTVTVCPRCGAPGSSVDPASVRPHLDAATRQPDAFTWSYCPTTQCPVVFFHDDATTVEESVLVTQVGTKGRTKPVPVCFCFSQTEQDIHDDLDRHDGTSTINEYIKDAVSAGRCSCTALNPAGVCCLPAVRRSIHAWSGDHGQPLRTRSDDPSDTTLS